MNVIVQLRDGQTINVEDFQRWKLEDGDIYRFYKNGTKVAFMEMPREVVSFILDGAEVAKANPQAAVNGAGTPQVVRQAALEQSKAEVGRFVFREHPKFVEIIDQLHKVEPIRIHNPTDKKRKTIAALCEASASHAPFDDDEKVVLTMKFRDLEDQPRFTIPKAAFEQMVGEARHLKPVMSPLMEFDGERYRAALNGEQVELWACGFDAQGKVGLQTTRLPVNP